MVVTIINLRLRFIGQHPSNAIKIVSFARVATFGGLKNYLRDAYIFSAYYVNCEFIYNSKVLPSHGIIESIIDDGYDSEKDILSVMATGARFFLRKEPKISKPPFSDTQIKSLVRALEKESTPFREEAISLLGTSGNPRRCVQPLIKALRDPYCHLRALAAEALGKLGEPIAVDPLLVLINDRNPDVVEASIHALELLGDPRACDLLAQKLCDPHFSTKRAAANALARLGWAPNTPEEHVLFSMAQENLGSLATSSDVELQLFDTCFHEGDSKTRHVIVNYIAQQESLQGTAILEQACTDTNPWVSKEARRALEKTSG